MTILPLRKILSLQAMLVAILPFILLVILVGIWLYPQILSDVRVNQVQLAASIATQIETHLKGSKTTIKSIASLQLDGHLTPDSFQRVLEKLVHSSDSLNSAYIVGPGGYVSAVALSEKNEAHRQDLMGIDLSGNSLFRKIVSHQSPFWSDTFLSVVGGGLSVAYGEPAGSMVVIGEIDSGSLIQYLKRISPVEEQLILVVDRHGQIIADQDGRYTAQQLNLRNIAIVKEGLKSSEPSVGHFEFGGRDMIGSMVKTAFIDWHVLVVMPETTAFRQMRTTIVLFASALLLTALVGIGGAVFAARRLAQRFEAIAKHARTVSEGKDDYEWPTFSVTEFNELTSDLKQMAESINEREAYNRVLFSDSPVPLIVIDSSSMKCVDGNQAAVRIFDLARREDLIGKRFLDFSVKPQHHNINAEEAATTHFTTCLENGFTFFEWIFQNSNHRVWHGDVNMACFRYGADHFVQLSIRDTTQRRQAQEEKEKLQAQFQQSQKLESVGRLAGGVAHDLNNLLTPILGYGEMLLQDFASDDISHKPIDQIVKAGNRARDIIGQLLAFSRKQTMKFKCINLNEVLARFHSLLRGTIREDIAIKIVPQPDLPLIKGDVGQLEQVIMNLAVNAQDAMPDGGRLTMQIALVELDENYAAMHQDVVPGSFVMLSVADTGQGMDLETRKHIFEPFFTTKDKDMGTGLGLATVYGIIKQHDGNVMVSSEPDIGTTFKIYLPVTDATYASEQIAEIEPESLHGSETILLVEDNERVRLMTLDILSRYGYEVCTAVDGMEALKILDTHNGPVDLLLTDVVMPGINGRELFDKISEDFPGIKALYMSGYSEEVIAHHGIMDEGVNFIQKPFSVQALAVKVREVLHQ